MTKAPDFFDYLQKITESYLTHRRKTKRIKKEKQKKKHIILDWVESFLWAASMVLLINQYLMQAYEIPSGSMINTLLIGDHIFVNKIIYGPELLPGFLKLPSPIKPKRNDIIIFENPTYISRGTAFDIAQRVIYMFTLTLVDIDRDESGDPKAHFLIKRAVGMGGDLFVSDRGNMRIRFAGENRFIDEKDFLKGRAYTHQVQRLVSPGAYLAMEAAGKATAFQDLGLPAPRELVAEGSGLNRFQYYDSLALQKSRLELLRAAYPHDPRYRTQLSRLTLGWYIPENWILPLGDNRDNSRDGRFFGPVRYEQILGKGTVIYWPLGRFGLIR
jgi:signal peptidase I